MAKYFERPVVIEATRWFNNGDHPEDMDSVRGDTLPPDPEGEVVRRFRRPDVLGLAMCGGSSTRKGCGCRMDKHGWIDTLDDGHTVCPGDWIITGIQGERYPCKPDIFEATYEAVAAVWLL